MFVPSRHDGHVSPQFVTCPKVDDEDVTPAKLVKHLLAEGPILGNQMLVECQNLLLEGKAQLLAPFDNVSHFGSANLLQPLFTDTTDILESARRR